MVNTSMFTIHQQIGLNVRFVMFRTTRFFGSCDGDLVKTSETCQHIVYHCDKCGCDMTQNGNFEDKHNYINGNCEYCGKAENGGNSGSPDSGSPDSGSPDSGSPDSGSPDSGSPDSGSPDSGTPDSGAPDSGTPDTGNNDNGDTGGGEVGGGNTDTEDTGAVE